NLREIARAHGRSRQGQAGGRGADLAAAFVIEQPESLVLLDGTGGETSKLVAPQLVLLRGSREEESAGVERVIAQKLEQRAVDLIAAGADRHVGLHSRIHAELGRVDGALDLEFLNGFDRRHEE